MSKPALPAEALAEVLERFPLDRPGRRTLDEVAEAQLRVRLNRIAALTEMLRSTEPGETAHLAERILLEDLNTVAAHFRGRTNAMRSILAKALADLRGARHA